MHNINSWDFRNVSGEQEKIEELDREVRNLNGQILVCNTLKICAIALGIFGIMFSNPIFPLFGLGAMALAIIVMYKNDAINNRAREVQNLASIIKVPITLDGGDNLLLIFKRPITMHLVK